MRDHHELEPLLRRAIEGLGAEAEHPSPEELSAYSYGELAAERGERVADHLSACATCRDLVLETEAIRGGEDDELGTVTAEDLEAAVEEALSRRRRGGAGPPASGASHGGTVPLFPRWSAARGPYALAASAALAAALVIWLAAHSEDRGLEAMAQRLAAAESATDEALRGRERLQRERDITAARLAEAERAAAAEAEKSRRGPGAFANAIVFDLRPRRTRGPGADAGRELALAGDAGIVTLVLELPAEAPGERFLLRLRDSAGAVKATVPGLTRNAFGSLTVALGSSMLAEGPLTASVYGVEPRSETLVAEYSLRVRREASPEAPPVRP